MASEKKLIYKITLWCIKSIGQLIFFVCNFNTSSEIVTVSSTACYRGEGELALQMQRKINKEPHGTNHK